MNMCICWGIVLCVLVRTLVLDASGGQREVYDALVQSNQGMVEALKEGDGRAYLSHKKTYDSIAEQNPDVVKYLENARSTYSDHRSVMADSFGRNERG